MTSEAIRMHPIGAEDLWDVDYPHEAMATAWVAVRRRRRQHKMRKLRNGQAPRYKNEARTLPKDAPFSNTVHQFWQEKAIDSDSSLTSVASSTSTTSSMSTSNSSPSHSSGSDCPCLKILALHEMLAQSASNCLVGVIVLGCGCPCCSVLNTVPLLSIISREPFPRGGGGGTPHLYSHPWRPPHMQPGPAHRTCRAAAPCGTGLGGWGVRGLPKGPGVYWNA